MPAQRMVTSNVLIRRILAEIFGRIGGWHMVGLGFGGLVDKKLANASEHNCKFSSILKYRYYETPVQH